MGNREEEGRGRMWGRVWKHAGRMLRDIRDCAGKRRKMEWERGDLREEDGVVGESELVLCPDLTLSRGKRSGDY